MKQIDFYFDFLSPYSYLAWTWVREQSYEFHFYPVPMASLITHYETKGPAQIEPKRNYLFKDLLRKTAQKNIAFTPPKELPFNSLYALRLALKGSAGDCQKEVIDAIFTAGWAQGRDIGNDDVLKEILGERGLLVADLVAKMESKEARRELRENLERALDNKLFGVPSFMVKDELFWGQDSIGFMELHLKNQDPLDEKKYQNFLNLFTPR